MKTLIAVVAIALLVPAAAAVADIPDQSRPDVGVVSSEKPSGSHLPAIGTDVAASDQQSPVQQSGALGTDVAASDQQSPVQRSAGAVAPTPAAETSGFEWADAAIGAAAAIALAGMAGMAATALRRRRRASAVAG